MSKTQSLFEGIATITTPVPPRDSIVVYDAYTKVTVETLGNAVRWFGSFEVMGSDIPTLGGPSHIEFSDGRRGNVIIRLDENGKTGTFQGKDLPPGFSSTPSVEIMSRPNPRFRRILSNTLFASSAGLLTAGLWIDGRGEEFAGTGVIWIVMAIATAPRRPHHCPPIEEDNDGHPDE